MKAVLIISAFLIFHSYSGTKNNQLDNAVDTVERLEDSTNRAVANELYTKYREFEVCYHNDLNYLGSGVVNPKSFSFQIITDTVKKEILNIENIENQKYVVPIFWKPDYLIFYMPVIHVSNKYYEVQVNTTMSVFVRKEDFKFHTWKELLERQTVCIEADRGYMEADIHSEIVFNADENSFEDVALIVEKVEGDWAFVREELDDKEINRFWVLWKSKNKLLVKPYFLM